MSAEEAHRRVEELFRHVEEDSIYVLIPHRTELAEKFVQYVKDFSELEEIDVEIFQTFDLLWTYARQLFAGTICIHTWYGNVLARY